MATTAHPPGGTTWLLLSVAAVAACAGCSTAAAATAPPHPVMPAPPPRDDGKPAKSTDSGGGNEHSAALEELKVAPIAGRIDKQRSVVIPLPDAPHWTRVRFMTVKSLVGFRYGKEHHGIVAGFVTEVDDNGVPGACDKSFESWATPWVDAFEVDVKHDAPSAFAWSPPTPAGQPRAVSIVDVDPVVAKTATMLVHDTYAAAWAAYPAWPQRCLVVGVAIPAHDDLARALEVRDRFVREVFPKIVVTATAEPKERY